MKLQHLPVNLQQTIIHSGQSDVFNTIVAFYRRHDKCLTVLNSHRLILHEIVEYVESIGLEPKTITYTAHFNFESYRESLVKHEYSIQLEEALELLKKAKELMSLNIVGAWDYHMAYTTDAFIVDDIEVYNDDYTEENGQEESKTLKYNGWLDVLNELEDKLELNV